MKRILGLDLGVASLGWAIVDTPKENVISSEIAIKGAGCVLINNSSETLRDFQKGVGENANTFRRLLRQQRNRNRHARARRFKLNKFLQEYDMTPNTMEYEKMYLWRLRSLAATYRLELKDLGRVLIHLSKKRGHVAGSSVEQGKTIGEFVYQQLCQDSNFRTKGLSFSRMEHIRELEKIILCQRNYYPDIFTSENTHLLIYKIIFFENRHKDKASTRKLCELESKEHLESKVPENKKHIKKYSPTAVLRSNPLYQSFSTLAQLQFVRIHSSRNAAPRSLTFNEQDQLFNFLQFNPSISLKQIPDFLGLEKGTRCTNVRPSSKLPIIIHSYKRKITGCQTYTELSNILGKKYEPLLNFGLNITELRNLVRISPSLINNNECKSDSLTSSTSPFASILDKALEEPLYILWREIFSVRNKKDLEKVLRSKYHILERDIIDKLCTVNFYSYGFSNISLKAIKKIMPFMLNGISFEEACHLAGYSKNKDDKDESIDSKAVSFSSTKTSDNEVLKKRMPPLKGIRIYNPVVEKVLSKFVTLVNKLIDNYGPFDSIHIELARELWLSKTERKKYYLQCQNNEQDYIRYSKKLPSMGILVSQKALIKFKLWEESEGRCVYCGDKIPLKEFITGKIGEVEHIIPRSMQFNDSMNNKVCSCRKCNRAKGNLTGFDFIESQGEIALKEFNKRVNLLFDNKKISKTKRENLLTKASDLSDEFISLQLVTSRYISSKALEMLSDVCREVIPTNGIFTSFLRNKWDYDSILHDLNLPFYQASSQVSQVKERISSSYDYDQMASKASEINHERIQGWSKRLDHRHHCIDALVIALTSTDFINGIYRLNTRHSSHISSDKLALSQPRPDCTKVRKFMEKVIVVHLPNDDKVRYSYRNNEFGHIKTLTPKAALHRQSLYGEITHVDKKGKKSRIKVIRVPLEAITTEKLANRVVDPKLRSLIKEQLNQIKSENEQDSSEKPLYSDNASTHKVRRVRHFSYHQNLTPLRFNPSGEPLCYIRTDKNHHLSFYRLPSGKIIEKVMSFYDYAWLRRLGLDGVINNPKSVWEQIAEKGLILETELIKKLPCEEAEHILTLMKNQLYIIGLSDHQITQAFERGDIPFLSNHIYRVQGISTSNYRFALHTQSETSLKNFNKADGRFILFSSLSKFIAANPRRVIVDLIGRIRLL